MSPRRNRREREREPGDERPLGTNLPLRAPPGWHARAIQPERAVKDYVCPGCNQYIRPRTAHVAAWRDGEEDLRRHWHTPCWKREHDQ